MTLLIIGIVAFLGLHLLPTVPGVRDRLLSRFGENGYKAAFSLLSIVAFVLLVWRTSDASAYASQSVCESRGVVGDVNTGLPTHELDPLGDLLSGYSDVCGLDRRDRHPLARHQHLDANHEAVRVAVGVDITHDAILALALEFLCQTLSELLVLDSQQGFVCLIPEGSADLALPFGTVSGIHW